MNIIFIVEEVKASNLLKWNRKGQKMAGHCHLTLLTNNNISFTQTQLMPAMVE